MSLIMSVNISLLSLKSANANGLTGVTKTRTASAVAAWEERNSLSQGDQAIKYTSLHTHTHTYIYIYDFTGFYVYD